MSYCDSHQHRLDQEAYVTYVERNDYKTDIPYKLVDKEQFESYIRSLPNLSWYRSEESIVGDIKSHKEWYMSKSRKIAEVWVSFVEKVEYRSYWVRK